MMKKQKVMLNYFQTEPVDLLKDDLFVTITLNRMPGSLVRSFALKVAHQYQGGISEAIQELMKKAIIE